MQFWHYSAATDVGLQRTNNEDSFLSCPELGLWIVADGMGGHASGEVASAIVIDTIQRKVAEGVDLSEAIQISHQQVLAAAANGHGGQGMGSTVVALFAEGNEYQISWVGDSRAYMWSPRGETKMTQLTTDHSYVQMLFQTGAISEDELDTHPEKNIITQCLGSIELPTVNVDTVSGEWKSGDWIVLCSDGLSDAVHEDKIVDVLSSSGTAQKATKNLIDCALSFGGRDNITVAVVQAPSQYANFLHSFSNFLSKLFK